MPVSRISASGAWSANGGASRCIGIVEMPWIGPRSSISLPVTFMMRPSVPGPTGTEIGAPVLAASIPRTRPSVESIAMHRTVFSPMCCCTSSTRLPVSSLIDGLLTRSAEKIGGSVPAPNSTSTTLPRTWFIFPGVS